MASVLRLAGRRAAQSRTVWATASLLVGGSIGAACAGGRSAAAAPPPPSAMDRMRQRAGLKDGLDPWGQPLGAATKSRMSKIDTHALSTQHDCHVLVTGLFGAAGFLFHEEAGWSD